MTTETFLTELVKFIGYAAIVFAFAWKIAVRVTKIELEMIYITKILNEHIGRVDKMFDRMDKKG